MKNVMLLIHLSVYNDSLTANVHP